MSTPRHRAIDTGMSDFYLYSKGWYVRGDLIDDMKRIAGYRARIKPEHVNIGDIIFLLVREVGRIHNGQPQAFEDFVLTIRKELIVWPTILPSTRQPTFDEVLIETCLGRLSQAIVQDGQTVYLELGAPNPKVLPLHPEHLSRLNNTSTDSAQMAASVPTPCQTEHST